MVENPRILVGTLYSDENEFEQCLESLQAQSYRNWEHRIFRDLPNREAHETLYREFMSSSESFDVFLKLDADMVFNSCDSMSGLVRVFTENPNLDHLVSVVNDWYSDSLIMGLHAFSNRCNWQVGDDLFVDPAPLIGGRKIILREKPAPFVWHSPDPSKLQAFSFGVHRAAKVVQRASSTFRIGQARLQWDLLTKTWQHFRSSGDTLLGLALMGAEQVFSGAVDHSWYGADRTGRTLTQFQRYENHTAERFMAALSPWWSRRAVRSMRFAALTSGPRFRRSVLAIQDSVREEIAQLTRVSLRGKVE